MRTTTTFAPRPETAETPEIAPEITALAIAGDSFVQLVERLAANKDVDVTKLERIIALQERILDRNAKSAFDAAFAAMQPAIPEITERGEIRNRDGQVQSRYAKNEDIQQILKPILAEHGFALGFRTEWPDKSTVRVVGVLTHREGHSRESAFLSDADPSGSKNAIQGLGSAVSYGHRYTTKDLLNITSRAAADGADDDGQASGSVDRPDSQAPSGFTTWWADLEAAAVCGFAQLSPVWNAATPAHRAHLLATNRAGWTTLRTQAIHVDADAKARASAGRP